MLSIALPGDCDVFVAISIYSPNISFAQSATIEIPKYQKGDVASGSSLICAYC